MTLSAGTRLGPYEIADEIGAGEMGVIFRARDTKLERDVAIKVLPESMVADAERLTRFDREAKTLASLNHPNIAQIYGIEESEGTTALITELVEGPTLSDRIAQDALSMEEALGIAMQISEALEAAHGQGIVHRDLKPANVKLRPDGTVKVLDFGIAKALEPENLVSGPQSPIVTTPATQAGVILGTAAYMSPEQAKGKGVDQRADIWAFGCLLYEMLTGQMAFGAEDVPTTLARVIDRDTDLDTLPAVVAPAVRRTIHLCLQKDVAKRVADIRDVRLSLEGAFETVSSSSAAAAPRPIWRQAVPYASVALMTAVAVAILARAFWFSADDAQRQHVTRFEHVLDLRQDLRATPVRVITIAPDGSSFVYNTTDGLYRRDIGELGAMLIPGTELQMGLPTFSPDGQWLAYASFESASLNRIAAIGGAPVSIADLGSDISDLNWRADDTIIISDEAGVQRVSVVSGTVETIVSASSGELVYGPRLLPDNETILITVIQYGAGSSWDDAQIVAHSLVTGERTLLVSGGADARYLPTGHLVYAFGDGIFAVPFDPDTLELSGAPVPLVSGVMRADLGQTGIAQFDVSSTGTLVYVVGGLPRSERELVWVDREGIEASLGAERRNYTTPRISPDGTKIALDVRDQEHDIWILDLEREVFTRLTSGPAEDEFPIWTRDGQRIAYAYQNRTVYWQAADASGAPELLAEDEGQLFPAAFTSDEMQLIVFGAQTGSEQDDIRVVHLTGQVAGEIESLLESPFVERTPALSPDGRLLAYSSTQSGRAEIYLRPFPDVEGGGRLQVSSGGGEQPVWAHSGRELFFRNRDALMVVSVETEPNFLLGRAQMLFEGPYALAPGGTNYDIDPGDERFLMIKEPEIASAGVPIVVVENWFEEVERLVPVPE